VYCRVFGEYEALGQLVKNRLSNMSAPSSTLWAYSSVRSEQELSWKVLLVPTSSPLVIGFQVRTQSDPMHVFGLYRDELHSNPTRGRTNNASLRERFTTARSLGRP
jgi:hypothetical protein